MLDFVFLGLVLVSSYSLGTAVMRAVGLRHLPAGFSSVVATATGLAGIAYGAFLLGAIHALRPWAVYLLLVAPLLLHATSARSFLRSPRRPELSFAHWKLSWFEVSVLVLIGMSLIYGLAAALAPSVHGDDIGFRLDIAKHYAAAHRIIQLPYIPQSGLPILMEMLYAVALLLCGPTLANLMHFSMGVLTVLAVYTFARELWHRPAGLVAAAVVASAPAIGWLSTVAYAEMGSALYQILAVLLLVEWLRSRRDGSLLGVGVMCGVALGISHSALITTAFVGLVLLARLFCREIMQPKACVSAEDRAAGRRALTVLSTSVVAAALPWYLHSWWATGSPVYPYCAGMLHHPEIAEAFRQSGTAKATTDYGLAALLKLPWTVTMCGGAFGGVLGPTALAVIPALLWIERWPSAVKILMGYAAFFLFWWWIFVPELRFLVPAFAVCAVAAGWTYHAVASGQSNRILRCGYTGLVLAALVLTRIDAGTNITESSQTNWLRFQVGVGTLDETTYISRELGGTWDVIQYIDDKLPRRAKILAVHETRGFYCRREFIRGDFLQLFKPNLKPAKRYKRLQDLGITHILHVPVPGCEQTSAIGNDLAAGHLQHVYASKGVRLLAVKYRPRRKG